VTGESQLKSAKPGYRLSDCWRIRFALTTDYCTDSAMTNPHIDAEEISDVQWPIRE
jgi:hypothetical protein